MSVYVYIFIILRVGRCEKLQCPQNWNRCEHGNDERRRTYYNNIIILNHVIAAIKSAVPTAGFVCVRFRRLVSVCCITRVNPKFRNGNAARSTLPHLIRTVITSDGGRIRFLNEYTNVILLYAAQIPKRLRSCHNYYMV